MKPLTKALAHGAILAAVLALAASPALAQRGPGAPPAAASGAKDADLLDLPAFPAEASAKQGTHVAGKTLNYTASVGALPVLDEKGRKIAEVVYTAYVLDGPRDPRRPVTFAFNGGPGAASVYLNLGAIDSVLELKSSLKPFAAPPGNKEPGIWFTFTAANFGTTTAGIYASAIGLRNFSLLQRCNWTTLLAITIAPVATVRRAEILVV